MKLKVKDKKKFNRFIFLSIMIMTVIFYGLFSINSVYKASQNSQKKVIIIRYGDTLWDIASKIDSSKDIREIIYDIESINSIKSDSIKPGDKIYLPLY